MDKTLYTIIVHSENFAGLLNQVTAVFTRRQINIESLNVSASSIKGVHKYTITAWTDKDTIEKVTKQITKKIDVLQAHYFTDDEIYQHGPFVTIYCHLRRYPVGAHTHTAVGVQRATAVGGS